VEQRQPLLETLLRAVEEREEGPDDDPNRRTGGLFVIQMDIMREHNLTEAEVQQLVVQVIGRSFPPDRFFERGRFDCGVPTRRCALISGGREASRRNRRPGHRHPAHAGGFQRLTAWRALAARQPRLPLGRGAGGGGSTAQRRRAPLQPAAAPSGAAQAQGPPVSELAPELLRLLSWPDRGRHDRHVCGRLRGGGRQ
jgi:hypothetical protein